MGHTGTGPLLTGGKKEAEGTPDKEGVLIPRTPRTAAVGDILESGIPAAKVCTEKDEDLKRWVPVLWTLGDPSLFVGLLRVPRPSQDRDT